MMSDGSKAHRGEEPLAEDAGPIGAFIRGSDPSALAVGARAPLPPPRRELTLCDAFQGPADS